MLTSRASNKAHASCHFSTQNSSDSILLIYLWLFIYLFIIGEAQTICWWLCALHLCGPVTPNASFHSSFSLCAPVQTRMWWKPSTACGKRIRPLTRGESPRESPAVSSHRLIRTLSWVFTSLWRIHLTECKEMTQSPVHVWNAATEKGFHVYLHVPQSNKLCNCRRSLAAVNELCFQWRQTIMQLSQVAQSDRLKQ